MKLDKAIEELDSFLTDMTLCDETEEAWDVICKALEEKESK